MTADDVKQILRLQPHPCEGGWYVRNYQAAERLPAACFATPAEPPRYPGPRLTGTAIYYLLEPETFSEMHLLASDEIFHHYLGDAVEMLQLPEGGTGERLVIGKDLLAGERPQVLAPRGVWQGSRLVTNGTWALLGCTVSPGFEYEDYQTGTRQDLIAGWPAWTELITALTHG